MSKQMKRPIIWETPKGADKAPITVRKGGGLA
jgi:hypothetical protein